MKNYGVENLKKIGKWNKYQPMERYNMQRCSHINRLILERRHTILYLVILLANAFHFYYHVPKKINYINWNLKDLKNTIRQTISPLNFIQKNSFTTWKNPLCMFIAICHTCFKIFLVIKLLLKTWKKTFKVCWGLCKINLSTSHINLELLDSQLVIKTRQQWRSNLAAIKDVRKLQCLAFKTVYNL